jgi:predicted nucleotidyltransferase
MNFNSEKIKQILAFFFLNTKRSLYLKELADILDIDKGNLSRYLSSLVSEGVIKADISGRQKYFSLDNSYYLLSELKKMISSEINLESSLRDLLSGVSGLEKAYIFGSYASGKFKDSSDIDLLLVGSHDLIAVRQKLALLQKHSGRDINIVDYSPREYQEKLNEPGEFLYKISQEPKLILK